MVEYDKINKQVFKTETTYNGYNYDDTLRAFRKAIQSCNPEKALYFALELYYNGETQRKNIINEILIAVLEDRGISNPSLFPQVYQLLVPIIKREEKEKEEEEEEEQWKTISSSVGDFVKNYSVSTKGNIRNNLTSKLMVPEKNKINFGRKNIVKVDEIVAKTFIENKTDAEFIQHIDGNPNNNEVKNLKWTKKLTTKKRNPKKDNLPLLFKFDEVNKTDDEDRLTYIYRFAVAVWMTANSTGIRLNVAANNLFADEIPDLIDEDDINEFIEKNGTPEMNRDEFKTALSEKNLANCLFYSNILYHHPTKRVENIRWMRSKKAAYTYIWECINIVSEKAPSHIQNYLSTLRNLATLWENNGKGYLLHIHFIHLWCLDPISAFVSNKETVGIKEILTPWGKIIGGFTNDFIQRINGKTGRIKKRYANVNFEIEPVLFPINLLDVIIDPENAEDEVFSYFNIITDEQTNFPDFNEIFSNSENGEVPDPSVYINRKKKDKNDPLANIDITLKNEDELWKPLYVFYLFFTYINNAEIFDLLEDKYGKAEDYFPSVAHPNPFEPDVDLVETDFLSFKPYIYEALDIEEDVNLYTGATPARKREIYSTSTLDFRTIPSPNSKQVSPINIIVTPRKKPTTPSIENKGQSRVATERKKTEKISPLKKKKQPKKMIIIEDDEEEQEIEYIEKEEKKILTPRKLSSSPTRK